MAKTLLFVPNDGLLEYGRFETLRDSNRKVTGQEFVLAGTLKYEYASIRQGDSAQYGGSTQSIDLKVRTYYRPDVPTSLKVRINRLGYEITQIDPANDRKSMYWYLSRKGEFDAKGQAEAG